MKLKIILIIACSFAVLSLSAKTISADLAGSPTNHLQLLANNFNMFMVINLDKIREDSLNQNKEFVETYFRVSVSKDNKLNFHAIYEAPVTSISKDKCQTKLKHYITESRERAAIPIVQAISFFYLEESDVVELLQESTYSLTIAAKENRELQISCS
ncbi:hypothetical protein AAEU32_14470 [Pseudoalteromonas sp. SSDWG2]|uniref:hypothetical protein n=1 Tax=Pseudoalteromonas sp. SSDWG2 TaxID=3139391 RepID=UPI003BA8BD40